MFPNMTFKKQYFPGHCKIVCWLQSLESLFGPWNLDHRLESPEYCHKVHSILVYENLL